MGIGATFFPYHFRTAKNIAQMVVAHRRPNPIESTFATVRLRTKRTKGSGSRAACLAMVFKLTMCAEKTWRALNGSTLLSDVIRGVQFVDGIKEEAA